MTSYPIIIIQLGSALLEWLRVHCPQTPHFKVFDHFPFEIPITTSPLFHAADFGLIAVTQELLDGGADPNTADIDGETPLHRAAVHGHQDVALLLLKYGAQVETTNEYDQTPFHWAAWSENEKMVDLLLEKGADINAMNRGGETALHYAANGSLSMLKHLLIKGASPEVQTNDGQTPLDWAAFAEREESMELLRRALAAVDVHALQSEGADQSS